MIDILPRRNAVTHDGVVSAIELAGLDAQGEGIVQDDAGCFDQPPLDPAARIAAVEMDIAPGTVVVRRIMATRDVGRAANPPQVQGQIHGGIAQGVGLALMEEYVPGRTENLHDDLIPTTLLLEQPDSLFPYGADGFPYGAVGVGEPALVATAPAILNAIAPATGTRVPATPDRLPAPLAARP